jgi:hypothetical protein
MTMSMRTFNDLSLIIGHIETTMQGHQERPAAIAKRRHEKAHRATTR